MELQPKIESVTEWHGAEGVDVKKKKCVQHASLADTNGKTGTETSLCINFSLMLARWPCCLNVCGTTEAWF